MTIAVTGPFASGTSTFVRLLGELGAETVSADEIVHDLLAEDRTTISRVVERFGDDVRGERGVNRRALGRKVFGDPESLCELEDILHPLVRRETQRRIAVSEAGLFVAEVPLLFEGGSGMDYDYTVAVVVPEERRRAWAAERGVDEAALMAIETRQLPQEEKARRADIVVQNDGDVDKLKKQAEELEARSLGGSVFEQEE
ncbi:MAG: dephospho-CoA kinase [Rubrobacteraceae bacterium]